MIDSVACEAAIKASVGVMRRRALSCSVLFAAALALPAASAWAGTLTFSSRIPAEAGDSSCNPKYMTGNCGHPEIPATLKFFARGGETNVLAFLEEAPQTWVLRDAVPIEFDESSDFPCGRIDERSVRCTQPLTDAALGDGDDRATVAQSATANVRGGPGNDVLSARIMFGEDGNDTLNGTAQRDTADGGLGLDTVSLGDGDDEAHLTGEVEAVDGGPGRDLASYASAPAAVIIDLSGGLGSDRLSAFERTRTSRQNDLVFGSPGNDEVVSFGGRDTISTGGGNDTVEAVGTIDTGLGNDRVDIARPIYDNDQVQARTPHDTLVRTGPGDDVVQDAMPPDVVLCGDGNDRLMYRFRKTPVWRTGPQCERGEAPMRLGGVSVRRSVFRLTAICPRGDGTLVSRCSFVARAVLASDRTIGRARVAMGPGRKRELVVRARLRGPHGRGRLEIRRVVKLSGRADHVSRARSHLRNLRRR